MVRKLSDYNLKKFVPLKYRSAKKLYIIRTSK